MYVYILLHAYNSLHSACLLSKSASAGNAAKSARCSSRRQQHAQQQLKLTRARVAFQQVIFNYTCALCLAAACFNSPVCFRQAAIDNLQQALQCVAGKEHRSALESFSSAEAALDRAAAVEIDSIAELQTRLTKMLGYALHLSYAHLRLIVQVALSKNGANRDMTAELQRK